MKKTMCFLTVLFLLAGAQARAVVYTGIMDSRAGAPYVPGFTAQSKAWVAGGAPAAGLALEWKVDDQTHPGSWTYTYTLVRNTARNKGFAFFDIETAADFTAANILTRQVLSAKDRLGFPIPSGLASITIGDPATFNAVHDFSNAPVTETDPATSLNKNDLSQYSGDSGRVPPGQPGGSASATPSVGPVPHPFYGIRVTFPGTFANIINFSYETCDWAFQIVTNRVPMWGRFFGWADQTFEAPNWYANFYSNHIDDPGRLVLAPADSLTGADPYQGWALVPGPLPSVLATLPADLATAVPVTEPVTASFAGPMDPASISAATFTLNNGGVPVAGAVSYDPATMSAAFTPNSQLLPNTTYTATITAAATDRAGNPLAAAQVWSFTTANQDTVPPTVTARRPDNGATFIATTTPFTATFSEEFNPATLTPATFTVSSGAGAVAGTLGFDHATRTATFTPTAPLANNTVYTATITTGVTDLAGNALAAPEVWTITTIPRETVLPQVPVTVPADASANVPTATPITAKFSEAMDPTTINAATFTVSGLTGTVGYDPVSFTATFTPGAPLATSTTYTATLTTAVKDVAGNPLPLAKVWTFATAAPDSIPPTVTGTSPLPGAANVTVTDLISAALSEQVDPATLPGSMTVAGQRYSTTAPFTVTGTTILSSSSFTLPSAVFIPDGPLPFGSVYNVTVTGIKDFAGNPMVDKVWSFTTMPDGILIPGETATSIADALKALRIAVNLDQPSQDDRNHGDVAPLGADGSPRPDGTIDITDAMVLLRKVVGLVSW